MRKTMMIAAAGLVLAVPLGAARRVAPRLQERMMRDVMPRCMDACFARMPPQRREFMIAHRRSQLDRIEARYAGGEPAAPSSGRVEVA